MSVGKTWISLSAQVRRFEPALATANVQGPLIELLNLDADRTESGDNSITVFRITVPDFQLTFGDRSGHDERSGFNSIGNDRVLGAAERFDSFDLNRRCAGAAHARAHLVQQLRQIANLRLARRIVNRRGAAGRVAAIIRFFSSGNGNFFEVNFRSD